MTEMTTALDEKLKLIQESIPFFIPELIIVAGIIIILVTGLIYRSDKIAYILSLLILFSSLIYSTIEWTSLTVDRNIFGMMRSGSFSTYLKLLFDIGTIITMAMSFQKDTHTRYSAEYSSLILTVTLGAHLIVMSTNLVMIFLSLELMSISSYILTGFAFKKEGAEGSLKYFLFGAVASAIMLYGFSILYGITGTLNITSDVFARQISTHETPLTFIAALLSLSGFLFKIAATPMHPWAPDVYEIAPTPVVAFFSTVPKLAGIGILTVFVTAVDGQSTYDWQDILGVIALLSITVGNFAALKQVYPKRMMAYSSIAQSGFLLLGILAYSMEGIQFMLFYATVYMLANFAVFINLHFFEKNGIISIDDFKGSGTRFLWPQLFLLVGFVSLTGLPPTAGFTAKLFIFSSLWESYQTTGKSFLLWLLVIGLLNTVVALFYYLRIPFFAFIKRGSVPSSNNLSIKKLFSLILVLLILTLFFQPELLMSLINRITFVF